MDTHCFGMYSSSFGYFLELKPNSLRALTELVVIAKAIPLSYLKAIEKLLCNWLLRTDTSCSMTRDTLQRE